MSRRTEYRPIVIEGWRDQRQSGDGGTAGYRKGIEGFGGIGDSGSECLSNEKVI